MMHILDTIPMFLRPFAHIESKGDFSTVPNLPGMVNDAFMLVLIISVVLLALVTFFMVFFAVKYRRSKNPSASEVKEPLLLEIAWTVIPTVLVFIMFYAGWVNFVSLRDTPEDAMPVTVSARMWSWQFQYENGRKSDVLYVPAGKSVKLSLHSSDVIHSFYVPALKIKEDAVPGMETHLWLVSENEGEYDIFCAEYCGVGHSAMTSKAVVMTEHEFDEWYEGREEAGKDHTEGGPAAVMELLDDNGCLDCHSIDGTELVGPTFRGILGRTEVVVTEGSERTLTVDTQYLRKSILEPDADIVRGYPDIMPSFEGELSESELEQIIDYLSSLPE